MGALHKGHRSLIKTCREECPTTVISIFVNPLQFAEGEDLEAYPRPIEDDLAIAGEEGVDLVFMPSPQEMAREPQAIISVPGITERYEGEHRPGHFDGVATVVMRLLQIVQPSRAYFGLKDLQQCAVIRALVDSLDVPVALRLMETIREESGLALSSRNAYFTEQQRQDAAQLHAVLKECAAKIRSGSAAREVCDSAEEELRRRSFDPDYLDCITPSTMLPSDGKDKGSRLVTAARFHGVRLIDNIAVHQSNVIE